MNKRLLVILIVLAIVLLAVVVGSRPFMATTDQQPGSPSPHAIDQ